MGTVDQLNPFTNYNCTVHAVTKTIVGSISDPIVVRTAEAGTVYYILVTNIENIHDNSSQSSSD